MGLITRGQIKSIVIEVLREQKLIKSENITEQVQFEQINPDLERKFKEEEESTQRTILSLKKKVLDSKMILTDIKEKLDYNLDQAKNPGFSLKNKEDEYKIILDGLVHLTAALSKDISGYLSKL